MREGDALGEVMGVEKEEGAGNGEYRGRVSVVGLRRAPFAVLAVL